MPPEAWLRAEQEEAERLQRWSELFCEFFMRYEQEHSHASAVNYLNTVKGFLGSFGGCPWEATEAEARAWAEGLIEAGRSTGYIRNVVGWMRRFYHFAASQKESGLAGNPFEGVRMKRERRYSQVETLSQGEVRELLRMIERKDSILGMRDYALVRMHLETGLKSKEVVGLRWGDIERQEGKAYARRKKGEPAAIPNGVWRAIRRFLRATGRLEAAEREDALFPSLRVPNDPPRPGEQEAWDWGNSLTQIGMRHTLHVYTRQAGMERVTMHTLRNTAAKKILMETGDAEETLRRLGLSDEFHTRRYLKKLEEESTPHWTAREQKRRALHCWPHPAHSRRSQGCLKHGKFADKRPYWLHDRIPAKYTWDLPVSFAFLADLIEVDEGVALIDREIAEHWEAFNRLAGQRWDTENLDRNCKFMDTFGKIYTRIEKLREQKQKIKKKKFEQEHPGWRQPRKWTAADGWELVRRMRESTGFEAEEQGEDDE